MQLSGDRTQQQTWNQSIHTLCSACDEMIYKVLKEFSPPCVNYKKLQFHFQLHLHLLGPINLLPVLNVITIYNNSIKIKKIPGE